MKPTEQLDKAFESALRDRENFIKFVKEFTYEQASWKPPDSEWSIMENIEHTLLVDVFFRETAMETLNHAKKIGNWITELENNDKMTLEALRNREQGFVHSPDFLLPKGRNDVKQMIKELYPSKMAIHESFILFRSKDLSLLIPKPYNLTYGPLNMYERIYYSGIHDYLHQEQMERVIVQKDFIKI